MKKRRKVIHVITRMIIGGAQENTLYTVEGIADSYDTILLTGPTIGPEGKLLELHPAKNYRIVEESTLIREINPLSDFLCFCKLLWFFLREKPDIVHTHSSKAGIVARLAAWVARVPVIIHTIHGLPFHPYQSGILNFIYITCEKICALVSDKIICVADAMWEKSLEAGIGNRNLFKTIRSGIDYPMFFEHAERDIRKQYNINVNSIVIGKIARLFELKGYEYVLESAREIISKHPEVNFLFVGGGILEETLKQQAEEYGIEKNIIFTGLVSPDEVPAYINAMDIVVHASLREGLARVIPQAYLLKKPVVSFDVDGAREIIKSGENGYLTEAKDVSGLTSALMRLVEDRETARTMAEKGHAQVYEEFSREYMVALIKAEYEQFF